MHVKTNEKLNDEIKEKDKYLSIKDKTIIDYENQIKQINQTQKQAENHFNNVKYD